LNTTKSTLFFSAFKQTLRHLSIFAWLITLSTIGLGQGKYESKFQGRILNEMNAEPVYGASIYFESLQKGTTTDRDGYFEIILPKGTFRITFSSIGLVKKTILIDLVEDVRLDLSMFDEVIDLDEVIITGKNPDERVTSLDIGKDVLDLRTLKNIPSFLGELDVVRSLIMLPGVSTVGEGSSGFNVRGGGVDQNLILQDGGVIFNPSHVFGFFSVFNPGTVQRAELYKTGIPARYGGRLSSVLEVKTKEGDFLGYHTNGGLGIAAVNLTVEGPIIEKKLSFLLGGRASYSDWMLNLARNKELQNSAANFQDANLKLTFRPGINDKFSYSGYTSHDNFQFGNDTTYGWVNHNHVFKWTHHFHDDFYFDVDATLGAYNYEVTDEKGIDAFAVNSKIQTQGLRIDMYKNQGKHKWNFGLENKYYQFSPGELRPFNEGSFVTASQIENEQSLEGGVYIEDDYKVTNKLSIRAGLRYSYFLNFGEGSDYIYGSELRDRFNIIDTVFYNQGEVIARYSGLEPRVNINFQIDNSSSIKASYNKTRQYLHLVTNTASVTPTDVWKTSNNYIKPQSADQFSLGIFKNLKDNMFETSVEVYYKKSYDVVDFKDGAAIFLNENIEADLISGISKAYGVELYVSKQLGNPTGWISYTYSRTLRKFDSQIPEERISKGNWFPSNYDKPHDLSATVSYRSNKHTMIGANFTYSTGRPQTVPVNTFDISTLTYIFAFSERNQGRIPDYYRLDLSLTHETKPWYFKDYKVNYVFSIYNVLARKNAYSIFYQNVYGRPPSAYKLSILGSMFPSMSINFEF
jgi:hypothetical protein